MEIKVSDYITMLMVEAGIRHVFMVPGGLAMHLNDSFAKCPQLTCVLNHHEQASAMAAEGYARINNCMAAVCTTVGPGATNAITGVLCAYQDSIPMFVITGQSRLATMASESGLNLRSRGIQECDICELIAPITKYCKLIKNPKEVRYCVEKALFLAKNGRPGPCWIDIPMDIQGKMIDPDELESFDPHAEGYGENYTCDPALIEQILYKLSKAQRPVIFAGNGIRLGDAYEDFIRFVSLCRIPVVNGMSSVDSYPTETDMFIGRGGTTGTRAGNFAIQNSDVLLSLGSRLNYNQTGFNAESWARASYKIINDIDDQEVKKDNINADLEVICDVKYLLQALNSALETYHLPKYNNWIDKCIGWKEKYPIVTNEQKSCEEANIYNFYEILTRELSQEINMVVPVGQARVIGSQVAHIKYNQRFITNATTASMGYGLPALIGACIGNNRKKTVLVTGEGSFQMNIQELQTIIQNKLPVIIIVISNGGYHTMKQTQKNFFEGRYIGIGPESNDLSFPDISKIAVAYGYQYFYTNKNDEIEDFVNNIMKSEEPVLAEISTDPAQVTVPKASSKRLPNGDMYSAPLEDMAPFLSRDELENLMMIPLLN